MSSSTTLGVAVIVLSRSRCSTTTEDSAQKGN